MYKLQKDTITGNSISVLRTDDDGKQWSIPMSEANTDYQAYLKWVAEGNTPLPAEE